MGVDIRHKSPRFSTATDLRTSHGHPEPLPEARSTQPQVRLVALRAAHLLRRSCWRAEVYPSLRIGAVPAFRRWESSRTRASIPETGCDIHRRRRSAERLVPAFCSRSGGMTAMLIEIPGSWRARVDRSGGPAACWPWRGALMTNGYGQTRVKMDGRWRGAGAHQVAYYVATGRWERRDEGRLVRHLCHNRVCCNPFHLRGGTPQSNAWDRHQRLQSGPLAMPILVLPVVGVAA